MYIANFILISVQYVNFGKFLHWLYDQSSVYLNREGTYFGQCSEICGILHSSMPISIQSVNSGKFLSDQIEG